MQPMVQDDLAKELTAPENGLKKSTFFEAISTRGLEQLLHVYRNLYAQAKELLPDQYQSPGNLVAIDESFVTATLSMDWADYRRDANKAKVHLGLDDNRSVRFSFHPTAGKADERPFIGHILEPAQTFVKTETKMLDQEKAVSHNHPVYESCRSSLVSGSSHKGRKKSAD